MMPLLFLGWDPEVIMGLLIISGFHSWYFQPLISKFSNIVLIIIWTFKVTKGDKIWPNSRLLILSCVHSLKIVIKHDILNWGLMLPVSRFLTRPTVLSCRGESPKYWSLVDLGSHLSNFLPSCSLSSNTYAGHPNWWEFCRALWEDFDLVNTSSGYRPL